MSKLVFVLTDSSRQHCMKAIQDAPNEYRVTVEQPKRSIPQNRLMWDVLTDIANQVDWYGERLTKEEWKDVLTAGLKRQKVVRGIDGGFVVIGASTSKMSKSEMVELTELAFAFGAEHGVRFTVPAER